MFVDTMMIVMMIHRLGLVRSKNRHKLAFKVLKVAFVSSIQNGELEKMSQSRCARMLRQQALTLDQFYIMV